MFRGKQCVAAPTPLARGAIGMKGKRRRLRRRQGWQWLGVARFCCQGSEKGYCASDAASLYTSRQWLCADWRSICYVLTRLVCISTISMEKLQRCKGSKKVIISCMIFDGASPTCMMVLTDRGQQTQWHTVRLTLPCQLRIAKVGNGAHVSSDAICCCTAQEQISRCLTGFEMVRRQSQERVQ